MSSKMLYAAASLALLSCAPSLLHGHSVHTLIIKQAPDDETGDAFDADIEAAIEAGWCNSPTEAAEAAPAVEVEGLTEEGNDALNAQLRSVEADRDALNKKLEAAEKTISEQAAEIKKLKAPAKKKSAKTAKAAKEATNDEIRAQFEATAAKFGVEVTDDMTNEDIAAKVKEVEDAA